MAKRLTHTVPASSGSIPKIGAGVAVGNHSVPPSTSPGVIFLSSMKFRPGFSGISDSGTKATIPGWLFTSDAMAAPAYSYCGPRLSSVKYSSTSSRRKVMICMSGPPSSFQLVISSSNTALISAAVIVLTGLSSLRASTYPSSMTGSPKTPAPSVKRKPMISRITALVTKPLPVNIHFTVFSKNLFIVWAYFSGFPADTGKTGTKPCSRTDC